jgi:glycosyltransferase involved in cell wall biosynthesis
LSAAHDSAGLGTIAVVLKGYPRLSETFIAQELRGLELLGFRLHLISLRHPTDSKTHPIHNEIEAPVTYLPEYLHSESWRVVRALVVLCARRGFWLTTGRWLKDLWRDPTRNRIRRFGQGCVLAAELPPGTVRLYAHFIHTPTAVTRYAAMITGRPWSCSAHAKDIWTSPDWELHQNLRDTDWVATCTEVGRRHLQTLSDDPSKVHLIYHGLDLARFPAPADGPAFTRDGASDDAPVRLLSVGRAVEKKGFDNLLTALSLLPSDLHWRWTHIGGGAQLDALKQQAAHLKIADRIEWQGARSQQEVLAAYQSSDLFVLPCRIANDGDRDGLPNVLVEAQSQRLACISTPISGVPELIEHDHTGLLVQPDDAHALSSAIAALCNDVEKRRRLAHAGERRVRRLFDMHQGLSELAGLFPESLRRSTTSPGGPSEALDAAE